MSRYSSFSIMFWKGSTINFIAILYLFFSIFCVSLCHDARDVENEWKQFKNKHKKQYDDPNEDLKRMNNFLERKQYIEEHNRKYERGEVSYKLKLNHFADKYEHEIMTFNMKRNTSHMTVGSVHGLNLITNNSPESFDWVQKSKVTPVKNQGGCGSCWAFSTTGTLESHYLITTNKSIDLSEQNLIDCAGPNTKYENNGCHGGFLDSAFKYVKDHGIVTEKHYHYKAALNTCKRSKLTYDVVKINDYNIITGERELQYIIATHGPVSVAVDARSKSFTFYTNGIYSDEKCDPGQVTHGMVAVGYTKDYWILKNSWGTEWGERGYMKLLRNGNNFCGIVTEAVYPVMIYGNVTDNYGTRPFLGNTVLIFFIIFIFIY